jgi:hypothetical protein
MNALSRRFPPQHGGDYLLDKQVSSNFTMDSEKTISQPIFKVRPVLSRRIYEDRVTMPVYGGGLYGECVTAGERMRSRSPLKTRFRIDHKSSVS